MISKKNCDFINNQYDNTKVLQNAYKKESFLKLIKS